MAYVNPNFPSKKAFMQAVKDGMTVRLYQPNGDLTGSTIPENGTISVEGPHYPQPHTWYAQVTLKDGEIVRIK